MTQFKFQLGTKVFFGKDCMLSNKSEIIKLGKRAFIVTGKASGKKSGALNDIVEILEAAGIEYTVFDNVENNPSLENVKEGGNAAAGFKADFIIGIGGGSPLDASKAIAVLATNDIDPIKLIKLEFSNKPLPIIAIPTTAGTGSEVTAASIMTVKDLQTKMSFVHEDVFPKVAFIDAKYTQSMSYEIAVSTAVDALSHAIEGYLNKTATVMSDFYALETLRVFRNCINSLIENKLDYDARERLLYASMLAGMTIAQTGTTIAHGMGYSLTYFKGIQHGKANGLLLTEYLKYNVDVAKEKVQNVLSALNLKNIDEFGAVMGKLIQNDKEFSEDELKFYASLAIKQRSTLKNLRTVTEEDMYVILKKSLV